MPRVSDSRAARQDPPEYINGACSRHDDREEDVAERQAHPTRPFWCSPQAGSTDQTWGINFARSQRQIQRASERLKSSAPLALTPPRTEDRLALRGPSPVAVTELILATLGLVLVRAFALSDRAVGLEGSC